MARDIFSSPIAEIAFEDIEHLTRVKAEEGVRVEFKEKLATSDGQQLDRWMRDQSGIGRVARDDIAKEVVALANAYGGAIVIGIVESNDNPKRADGEFLNNAAGVWTNPELQEYAYIPWLQQKIGPYSIGNRATFRATFELIEKEIWDAFGLNRRQALKFDIDEVFRSIGM